MNKITNSVTFLIFFLNTQYLNDLAKHKKTKRKQKQDLTDGNSPKL